MNLESEVNVQRVERVQDWQKALSEIIETFLQELLARWRKSVTGVPDRGTGKPADHRRKTQILVRFGVEKISAGSRRSFHVFCCTLPHAFGMPITPDLRRQDCLMAFIDIIANCLACQMVGNTKGGQPIFVAIGASSVNGKSAHWPVNKVTGLAMIYLCFFNVSETSESNFLFSFFSYSSNGVSRKISAHFTAPKVKPRTRYRCAARAPIQTGRTTTVPAAMMLFHSTLTGVTYSVSPTGAVRVPAPVSTLAKRNSFQAKINDRSPVAIIPGIVSGTVMRRNVARGLQPSTCAASSISMGISAKKPRISQTVSGKFM